MILLPPRSLSCPSCQRVIDIAVWLTKGARCGYCHEPLSAPEAKVDTEPSHELTDSSIHVLKTQLTAQRETERKQRREHEAEQRATARPAAEWMANEFRRLGTLRQADAALHILHHFGDHLVYRNHNGNIAISPVVLQEFRRLTNGSAKWNKDRFRWERHGEAKVVWIGSARNFFTPVPDAVPSRQRVDEIISNLARVIAQLPTREEKVTYLKRVRHYANDKETRTACTELIQSPNRQVR